MSKKLFGKFFIFLLVVGLLFAVAPTRQALAQTGVTLNVAQWSAETNIGINGRPTVLYDGASYHMWYCVGDKLFHSISATPTGFTGGTQNTFNTVPVELSSVTVVKEGGVFYLITYGASDRVFSIYKSSDGNAWTYEGDVFNGAGLEVSDPTWKKIDAPSLLSDNGTYKLYFQVKPTDGVSYAIYMAESGATTLAAMADANNDNDFTLANNKQPVLTKGAFGESDEIRVMHPNVVKSGSTYYMWYTGVKTGAYFTQNYAYSSNGVNWTKGLGNPVQASTLGDYAEPSVVVVGDTWNLWYMYGGNPIKHVSATGPFEFQTIQAAINAAPSSGATINVAAGTYEENIIVDKPLTLLGPNHEIAGYSDDRVDEAIILNSVVLGTNIKIESTDVTIKGFYLEGNEKARNGIWFIEQFDENKDINITIQNNIIRKMGNDSATKEERGRGIYFTNSRATGDLRTSPYVYGIDISYNYVQYAEGGIILRNNTYANIGYNKVENANEGILVEWVQKPIDPALLEEHTVHHNTVIIHDEYGWNENTGFAKYYPDIKDTYGCSGIRLNIIGGGAKIIARENNISASTASHPHAGFNVASLNSGKVQLFDNVITDVRDGIRLWGTQESGGTDDNLNPLISQNFQVFGGTITGGTYGIHITDWYYKTGYDETVRGTVGLQNRVYLDGNLQISGQSGYKIRIFNDYLDYRDVTVKLGMNLVTNVDFDNPDDVEKVNEYVVVNENKTGNERTAEIFIIKLVAKVGENDNHYTSIQDAIDAAEPGGTVIVGHGIHEEQLVINKNLTLQGAGEADTIIKAPTSPATFKFPESGSTWEPVVFAFGGTADNATPRNITGTETIQVAISGFTVDGNDRVPNGRSAGILLRNAGGTVSDNTVRNMSIDGKETFGIVAYGNSNVTITGNEVSGYARGGIGANGDGGSLADPVAIITNNTVTGPGMDEEVTWAPNGIQIGYGATGVIRGNTVSGNGWPGTDWTGSGILVYASSSVEVDENTVEDNQTGIAVGGSSSSLTASGTSIHDNTVDGNTYGISIQDWSVNTTIEDNIVQNSTYDGIDICNFYGNPPTGTLIQSNTITGNNTEDDETSGGIWIDEGVDGDEVTVHENNIVGNNGYGILNTSTIDVVDASPNWWGSAAGPAAGQISGNVDYNPWCGDAECSFFVTGVTPGETPEESGTNLQTTLDNAAPGDTIYVPDGEYKVSGGFTLSIVSTTLILGDGVVVKNDSPCFVVSVDHTKVTTESIGGAVCVPTGGSNGIDVAAGLTDITIEGIEIDGSDPTGSGDGIHFAGAVTDVTLRDNFIHDMKGVEDVSDGDGVHFTAVPGGYVEIKGNLFMDNAGEGVDNAAATAETDTIDATYNAWGDYDGPAEATGGDGISTNVDADPWTHVDVYVEYKAGSSRYADKIAVGEEITYNVYANLQNAVGAQFTLSFNPAKLEVTDTDTTDTVFPSDWSGLGPGVTYNNTTGKITFAGGATSAVSGEDQFLFSVTFEGKAATDEPNPLYFDEADEALFGMDPDSDSDSDSSNIYAAGMAGVVDVVVYTNDAPVAWYKSVTTSEDTALLITLVASDEDGDALTYAIVAHPAHGTLTLSGNVAKYTPALDFNGTDTFTYKANDGLVDSNFAKVSIKVTAVNDAPVAQDQSVETPEDTALPITLVVTDVDGDTLTYAIVDEPDSGTVTLDGNIATYTPAANFHGTDTFTFKANDGTVDSNVATVTITVTDVKDQVEAVDDFYTIVEGTTLSVDAPGVLANDIDVDNNLWSATLVTGVQHGSLSLLDDGSFTYIPDPGFSGTDTFVYKLITYLPIPQDLWTDEATVTITVEPLRRLFLPLILR